MNWNYEWTWFGWEFGFGYDLTEWGIGGKASFDWCFYSFEVVLGPLYLELEYWR